MRAEVSGRIGQRYEQRGYVLLSLLLIMALLVIAAAVIAPSLAFQIRRDREEELVHRGVQYSRAIRSFAKKTGRYPASLDQLQGSSGVRYIRKLYKDPVTGGDFRLLHGTDIPALKIQNLNPGDADNPDGAPVPPTDPGSASGSVGAPGAPDAPQGPVSKEPATPPPSESPVNTTGQVIFGVASKSKAATIREFNHKTKYNEWLFFYDPQYDRGAEIKGPTPLNPILTTQTPAAKPPDPNSNSQQ